MKYDRDRNPIKPAEEPIIEPTQQEPVQQLEAQPEVEQEAHEATEIPTTEVQTQPEQSKVEKQAPSESWKILRDKAQKAEQRAQELEQALLQAQAQKQAELQQEPQESQDISIEEDALVEGKHLKKVNKQIKNLEDQLKYYQQQSSLNSTEAKLKSQYPDFDKIVSKENLENLRTVYPEIAATINSSPDLYNKAVSAYTMIKKLGIMQEDLYVEDKAQAQKNAAKPKPLVSVSPQQGDSPLSRANAFASGKLSDELKKSLWREMEEARK